MARTARIQPLSGKLAYFCHKKDLERLANDILRLYDAKTAVSNNFKPAV